MEDDDMKKMTLAEWAQAELVRRIAQADALNPRRAEKMDLDHALGIFMQAQRLEVADQAAGREPRDPMEVIRQAIHDAPEPLPRFGPPEDAVLRPGIASPLGTPGTKPGDE